jgi:hypothetical protein
MSRHVNFTKKSTCFSFKNVLNFRHYDFLKNSFSYSLSKLNFTSLNLEFIFQNSYLTTYLLSYSKSPNTLNIMGSSNRQSIFKYVLFTVPDYNSLLKNSKFFDGDLYITSTYTKTIAIDKPGFFTKKYMTEWVTLLRHKFLLNKINKSKILGSYPVSKNYFFNNNIFYPSITNVLIFNKSLRRFRDVKTNDNIVLSPNLILLSKLRKDVGIGTRKVFIRAFFNKVLNIQSFQRSFMRSWKQITWGMNFLWTKKARRRVTIMI